MAIFLQQEFQQIHNNSGLELKSVRLNNLSTGSNDVITPKAGKKVVIVYMHLNVGTSQAATLSYDSTVKFGLFNDGAKTFTFSNGGLPLPAGDEDEVVKITFGGAPGNTDGFIMYYEI